MEWVNSSIEAYLRAYVNWEQDDWEEWLNMAEFAYNDLKHTATEVTPFFANTGQNLNSEILPEEPGEILDKSLATEHANKMQELDKVLRARLLNAQDQMQHYYDTKHKHIEFEVRELVWLMNIRHTNMQAK